MHSAPPDTMLARICEEVERLGPGKRVTVSRAELTAIGTIERDDQTIGPARQVIEAIQDGHARFRCELTETRNVTFIRR